MLDHSLRSMDIPTLVDCDCKAIVWNDKSGVEIEYCPMHEAAPALLEALERAEQTVRNLAANLDGDLAQIARNEATNLREALAQAKG